MSIKINLIDFKNKSFLKLMFFLSLCLFLFWGCTKKEEKILIKKKVSPPKKDIKLKNWIKEIYTPINFPVEELKNPFYNSFFEELLTIEKNGTKPIDLSFTVKGVIVINHTRFLMIEDALGKGHLLKKGQKFNGWLLAKINKNYAIFYFKKCVKAKCKVFKKKIPLKL